MKCKNCFFCKGETKGICTNEKSDQYTDFVDKELECNKGESKPVGNISFRMKNYNKREAV